MLAGCTKQKTKEVENEIPDFFGFTTDFETTVNDVKICGKAEYVAFNTLKMTFTSPETLKDIKINVKDGECEITLCELSFSMSCDSLPYKALPNLILSCGENIKSSKHENGVYSFVQNDNKCEIYAENETKHFQKLVVNGVDTIFFENFTYNLGQSD